MKKVLVALLLTFAVVSVVYAAATKFTDLQCENLTVTNTLTADAVLPVVDVVVSSPTKAGLLVRTSASVVYISTGTGTVSSWSKVGGQ